MADTLEEALNSAESNQDEETGAPVYDRTPLIIDNDLRTIKVPKDYVFGVFNDKDVLSVPFEMPRYYDGVDLNDYSIQINYTNAKGVDSFYEVTERTASDERIFFEWLLGSGVFVKEGLVTFTVCLRILGERGIINNEFNTTLAQGVVLEGLEVEKQTDPKQYSILAQMKAHEVTAKYYAEQAEEAVAGVALESERLAAVEEGLSSQDDRLTVVEGIAGSESDRITAVEQDLEDTTDRIDEIDARVASNSARITTAEGTISSQGSRLSSAETELASQDSRLDTIEDDLFNYVNNGWVTDSTGYFAHGETVLFTMTGMGGGSGTNDYEELINLPEIESVTVFGSKTIEDYGINRITNTEIEEMLVV